MSEIVKELQTRLEAKELGDAMRLASDNRFHEALVEHCGDAISVVSSFLTEKNFSEDNSLFGACEAILKIIAEYADCTKEVIFELLEIIEHTKSHNCFTSTLKAMQICLLKTDKQARTLEWCLNSVILYVSALPLSDDIKTRLDKEEEQLLEEDDEVRTILMLLITITLFYEPILKDILENSDEAPVFRDVGISKRNLMACFLLQLLASPLACLDLSSPMTKKVTNTYSRQCAETFCNHLSDLLGHNPYFLMKYIENKVRWPPSLPKAGVYENASDDLFAHDEKVSIIAAGIYFYLIFVEDLMPEKAPKIYKMEFIFESCLYCIRGMLESDECSINHKAIKLCAKLMQNFEGRKLDSNCLEVDIYFQFAEQLSKVVVFGTTERNRKVGLTVLKTFIFMFDRRGSFLLLKNLMRVVKHSGLFGYLSTLYKEMIAEALNSGENALDVHACGLELRFMLLSRICWLANGAETDIMENSDRIVSALNLVRFLVLRDGKNQTGTLDLIPELKEKFIEPIRIGLDMSRAHYKEERNKVEKGLEKKDNKNMTVTLLNGDDYPDISKEQKIQMLGGALNTFDLIESLVGRVNECFNEKIGAV